MPGSRRCVRRDDEIISSVFRPSQARSGRNDSTRATRENIIGTLVRFGGAAMSPMFRYFLGFQLATDRAGWLRSEEHTSELQSLMRISYAVLCLTKKNKSTSRPHYCK